MRETEQKIWNWSRRKGVRTDVYYGNIGILCVVFLMDMHNLKRSQIRDAEWSAVVAV